MAPSSIYSRDRETGFSLLEMVVAVAILGISLVALYRAAGGATKIVGIDEKYVYGAELARSLLDDHASVPASGMSSTGETRGGFSWSVRANPVSLPELSAMQPGALQEIDVRVAWRSGGGERDVVLHSIVAGRQEPE